MGYFNEKLERLSTKFEEKFDRIFVEANTIPKKCTFESLPKTFLRLIDVF